MKKNIFCTLISIFLMGNIGLLAQEKSYKIACIAFYNLENLFDTIDDPNVNDKEFLPNSPKRWDSERYYTKLKHLSEVIAQLGNEYTLRGPVIIGVSEVENIRVLQDLVNTPALKPMDYGIVHFDSPDRRGIDVAMLYQKKYFEVTNAKAVRLTILGRDNFHSRDQLVVSGIFAGERIHVIMNHWPSRRGGEKKSAPLRMAAANLCRSLTDSLLAIDPQSKVIIMGDLNDNPTDASLVKNLKAVGEQEQVKGGKLFNPMYKMYKNEGIGSLAYRDSWNLLDHIIVSPALLGEDKSTYKFFKAQVFNKPFLTQKSGAYAGYPWRTFVGNTYLGGYSDHFPVYIFLIKEK